MKFQRLQTQDLEILESDFAIEISFKIGLLKPRKRFRTDLHKNLDKFAEDSERIYSEIVTRIKDRIEEDSGQISTRLQTVLRRFRIHFQDLHTFITDLQKIEDRKAKD